MFKSELNSFMSFVQLLYHQFKLFTRAIPQKKNIIHIAPIMQNTFIPSIVVQDILIFKFKHERIHIYPRHVSTHCAAH
ncbi:hypothetical protein XELAEV_18005964mg [Xenopus laevis]|uniref:Uncharacterized protein n=1 Tax=Xenopus laevis TaxID=8355 RepID=A0A974I3D3_XENLA|nr:hypothetical protein XELAEV_18005964mg [Xenopus laevis]